MAKTSAFLQWTKPEHDGGAKIESYIIELLKSGTDEWVRVADGIPSLEYFLRGLMEKQEYSFRVRAVNAAGESEPSEPSDPVLCKERLSKSHYLKNKTSSSFIPPHVFPNLYDLLSSVEHKRRNSVQIFPCNCNK